MDENVRFFGPVHAGFPSPAQDYGEQRLSLDSVAMTHRASVFLMLVVGDSMVGACIQDGDTIVVDRAITARHNHLVVARVGNGLTLKRLQIVRRKVFLKPEHQAYPVLHVTGGDYAIEGVVTYILRKAR